jgi:antitoxin YefM
VAPYRKLENLQQPQVEIWSMKTPRPNADSFTNMWYAQTYQRRYVIVKRLRIEQDVQPVSAFRANAAKLIEQVQTHKRALVLTQRGRSAAVVLDPAEYDRLIETLELLQDVHEANNQIAAGKAIAEKKAKEVLLRPPRK